jgi:hypothetical protein
MEIIPILKKINASRFLSDEICMEILSEDMLTFKNGKEPVFLSY